MMIVNYASSIVNKLGASLTDDARVIIYDHHVFVVKATDVNKFKEEMWWVEADVHDFDASHLHLNIGFGKFVWMWWASTKISKTRGLYYKDIYNRKLRLYYKCSVALAGVINYAPRVVNYTPRFML